MMDDKSILDMVHDTTQDLHAAGVMKETKLLELDALCLTQVKEYNAEQIKLISTKCNAGQA